MSEGHGPRDQWRRVIHACGWLLRCLGRRTNHRFMRALVSTVGRMRSVRAVLVCLARRHLCRRDGAGREPVRFLVRSVPVSDGAQDDRQQQDTPD
ncbi:hypothetical protein Stsp02_31610 [Streptomyces sp. NBRC 14336]|nr:hypothetical protein Stsp02_31610 [Streptomyces sp. NBRC 14336]